MRVCGPRLQHFFNVALRPKSLPIHGLGCLSLRSSGGHALATQTQYTFGTWLSRQFVSLSEALIFFQWGTLQTLSGAHVTECVSSAWGCTLVCSFEQSDPILWLADLRTYTFKIRGVVFLASTFKYSRAHRSSFFAYWESWYPFVTIIGRVLAPVARNSGTIFLNMNYERLE